MKELWTKETKKIFLGILVYVLAGILIAIFQPIEKALSVGSSVGSLMGGSSAGVSAASTIVTVCTYIFNIGVIFGLILVFLGLKGFKAILEGVNQIAVGKLYTAFILAIIAVLVGFIPFMGWAAAILNIVAFILMILGYSALKKSETFPELGRKGASLLFISCIIALIGAFFSLISWIPLIGIPFSILAGACSIVTLILTLVGWNKIKNAA